MPDEESKVVTVGASLGATIVTAPYENQKVDIWVSGIPVGASKEFIEAKMKEAQMTLHEIVDLLAVEMGRRLREDYGR